jgi:hypothetical protein
MSQNKSELLEMGLAVKGSLCDLLRVRSIPISEDTDDFGDLHFARFAAAIGDQTIHFELFSYKNKEDNLIRLAADNPANINATAMLLAFLGVEETDLVPEVTPSGNPLSDINRLKTVLHHFRLTLEVEDQESHNPENGDSQKDGSVREVKKAPSPRESARDLSKRSKKSAGGTKSKHRMATAAAAGVSGKKVDSECVKPMKPVSLHAEETHVQLKQEVGSL